MDDYDMNQAICWLWRIKIKPETHKRTMFAFILESEVLPCS